MKTARLIGSLTLGFLLIFSSGFLVFTSATTYSINSVTMVAVCQTDCIHGLWDIVGSFGTSVWSCTDPNALSESSCNPTILGSYQTLNSYGGCNNYPLGVCQITGPKYTGTTHPVIHFTFYDDFYVRITFNRAGQKYFHISWSWQVSGYSAGANAYLTFKLLNNANGKVLVSQSCTGPQCIVSGGWTASTK